MYDQTANEKSFKSAIPIVVATVLTALVVGGSMYFWNRSQNGTTGSVTMVSQSTQAEKYNCEQSGGTFTNGTCDCPSEFGEDMYDKATGYCQSEHGGPGGNLQTMTAQIMELGMLKSSIVKYHCEQSGGAFNGESCDCPSEFGEDMYDAETGYCMTSFGIPGGNHGQVAQKLQELEMLKNQ